MPAPDPRRIKKSAAPCFSAQRGEHVAEGWHLLAIPRRSEGPGTWQPLPDGQVPNHGKRIGPEGHGGGALDCALGAVLGVLEAELPLGLVKSDLDGPAQAVIGDDGLGVEGEVGGEEDVVVVVAGPAADEDEAEAAEERVSDCGKDEEGASNGSDSRLGSFASPAIVFCACSSTALTAATRQE